MNFGDRIKEYRKKNNLSQKRFSEKIGISRSYLSELERNKKEPSFELKEKILKLLNKEFQKKPNSMDFLSENEDLKVVYKKKIISDMKSLNTYKNEFEQIVDIYADLLVQYRNMIQQYQNNKLEHDTYMLETGKKPPLILMIENLRKDIITYSDRLILSPKAINGIEKSIDTTSTLEEALNNFD